MPIETPLPTAIWSNKTGLTSLIKQPSSPSSAAQHTLIDRATENLPDHRSSTTPQQETTAYARIRYYVVLTSDDGLSVLTTPPFAPTFTEQDIDVIAREPLYQGFFALERVKLRHRLFAGGWSREIQREIFMRGPAVGVVLYDPVQDTIGLLQQFRIGALTAGQPAWCMEIVAGILDPGETPEQVAHRETREEANLELQQLEPICHYLVSPGGSNESMHLFCGITHLPSEGGVHGLEEEGEDILFQVFEAEQVFANLYSGPISNAPSLIALQWLQANRARLRETYPQSRPS